MQIRKTITIAAGALLVTGASLGGVALASSGGGPKADTTVSQAVESSEAPGTETESGSETEGAESDGPGGHEDPPGNVDHQFEGEE